MVKKNKWKKRFIEEMRLLSYSMTASMITIAIFISSILFFFNSPFVEYISYPLYTENIKDDQMVDVIVRKCEDEETEIDKVYCVYHIVSLFYNYQLREGGDIHSPTKTLLEGGLCRDYAVMYCAIFDKLNIKCQFKHTNNHIFNVIDLERGYCIIDQARITC